MNNVYDQNTMSVVMLGNWSTRGLLLCFSLLAMTACTPSLSAWERGNLAKPQMALETEALDSELMKHMFSSKEAASGGYGVGGGGCGCN